jgi:aspartate ammonia-lyase
MTPEYGDNKLTANEHRTEKDFLGAAELPREALYGIQSLRAADNFKLDHKKTGAHRVDGCRAGNAGR